MIIFETTIEAVSRPALKRFALRAQKLARAAGEVDILIATDQRLRQLNQDFRGKDKATDVLSFTRNGTADLGGDIAISAAYARRSARRHGHSLKDELKILILHGMLHLAGHDHEADHGEMARLEAELRRQLRLPGSLTERASTRSQNSSSAGRGAATPARAARRRRSR